MNIADFRNLVEGIAIKYNKEAVIYVCNINDIGNDISVSDMRAIEKDFNIMFKNHGNALLAKTCVYWTGSDSENDWL